MFNQIALNLLLSTLLVTSSPYSHASASLPSSSSSTSTPSSLLRLGRHQEALDHSNSKSTQLQLLSQVSSVKTMAHPYHHNHRGLNEDPEVDLTGNDPTMKTAGLIISFETECGQTQVDMDDSEFQGSSSSAISRAAGISSELLPKFDSRVYDTNDESCKLVENSFLEDNVDGDTTQHYSCLIGHNGTKRNEGFFRNGCIAEDGEPFLMSFDLQCTIEWPLGMDSKQPIVIDYDFPMVTQCRHPTNGNETLVACYEQTDNDLQALLDGMISQYENDLKWATPLAWTVKCESTDFPSTELSQCQLVEQELYSDKNLQEAHEVYGNSLKSSGTSPFVDNLDDRAFDFDCDESVDPAVCTITHKDVDGEKRYIDACEETDGQMYETHADVSCSMKLDGKPVVFLYDFPTFLYCGISETSVTSANGKSCYEAVNNVFGDALDEVVQEFESAGRQIGGTNVECSLVGMDIDDSTIAGIGSISSATSQGSLAVLGTLVGTVSAVVFATTV